MISPKQDRHFRKLKYTGLTVKSGNCFMWEEWRDIWINTDVQFAVIFMILKKETLPEE